MTSTTIVRSLSDTRPKRVHYIDWLRILAVLMLMPFHTGRIFDIWEPFYAKNQQVSEALTFLFVGAFNAWHMPLFFLLAGASTWFALRFRGGRGYVKERFKRLLVPFIFGLLVIIPPQSYFGLRTYSNYTASFFQFYPRFFEINPEDLTGYKGGFTPGHLWFILFLFVLSLVALPLFLYLRRETGQRLIDRLATFFARPRRIFLLAIPLAITTMLPGIGGKNPFYYLVLLIYGYVMVTDPRFEEAMDRYKTPALILGVSTLGGLMVLAASDVTLPEWLEMIVWLFFSSFLTCFFLIAILGFGRKLLNFTKGLRYAREAAYPFYILHQTAIVIVGYHVVQWNASVLIKFLAIVVAATVMTLLVYELMVRRNNRVRPLFGMKPRAEAPSPRPHQQCERSFHGVGD